MFKYQPTWLLTVFITWAAVAIPSMLRITPPLASNGEYLLHFLLLGLILLVVNESQSYGYRVRHVILLGIIGIVGLLFYVSPLGLTLIYSVMLCSILVFYVPKYICFLYIFAIHGLFLLSQANHWEHGWLFSDAAMFIAFHFFSLVVTQRMVSEREAKEALALTNAKLESTQTLLSTASAQSERLRLARDLHDEVGHALTSLIINLDIARRTCTEAQQPQLESCYEQAKAALQTTRKVVSDKRESVGFDLNECLTQLAQQTPRVQVHLHVVDELDKVQLDTAQCLLKCCQEAITNTLKHANTAENVTISLKREQSQLELVISDDGMFNHKLNFGNGLTGMQERVNQLGGTLLVSPSPQGLTLTIRVPYE